MQTMTKRPGFPEDKKPVACRKLGCEMSIGSPSATERPAVIAVFVHTHGEQVHQYPISRAAFDDASRDLWGEIKPWLESLHEPPRPMPDGVYPLVPEDRKPDACRRLRCEMMVMQISHGPTLFLHARRGHIPESYPVCREDFEDVEGQIFETLTPWMAALHEK